MLLIKIVLLNPDERSLNIVEKIAIPLSSALI